MSYEVMLGDGRVVEVCELQMVMEHALGLWLDTPAYVATYKEGSTAPIGFIRNADVVLSPHAWLAYRHVVAP